MTVLVAYASKHGATQQIAERIAEKLRERGHEADVRPVKASGDLTGYDAFVIGSAVYFGSWLKEATQFVRRNQAILVSRPVWLFSSGPIGPCSTDDQGRDLAEEATPKEIAEFAESLKPREHRVFFGKLDRDSLGFVGRLVASMPAFPGVEGDFRDWATIESWAGHIAQELMPATIAGRVT